MAVKTTPVARQGVRRSLGRRLRRAGMALGMAALALALTWLALAQTRTRHPGPAFNRGTNAIWIAHAWVEEERDEAAVAALARELTARQIRYVYAHVGPLEADGTIPPERYPRAEPFALALKRHAPDLVLLAWIGQVERRGGGILDLDDTGVRGRVAATAGHFAATPGWDGVHLDIEPVFDADARFLALLDETRPALGGRTLSLATPKWLPGRRWDRLVSRPVAAVWSAPYYREVARRADQLAVMMYDTAIPWGRAYSLYTKQQTTNILWATRDTETQVLIGVPVYSGDSAGFHERAENITTGLRGITAGLNNSPPESLARFAGVAIYPHWQADGAEWAIYERQWLGRAPDSR